MVMQECIILVGVHVLTGLYPHCCNGATSVVSESDHWARYTHVVVSCTIGHYHNIALATGQYPVYCSGISFDLHHRWDTIIVIVIINGIH